MRIVFLTIGGLMASSGFGLSVLIFSGIPRAADGSPYLNEAMSDLIARNEAMSAGALLAVVGVMGLLIVAGAFFV